MPIFSQHKGISMFLDSAMSLSWISLQCIFFLWVMSSKMPGKICCWGYLWVRSSPDGPDFYVEMFELLRRIRQIHGASSVHRALHCKQLIPHVVRNPLNFLLTLNSSYVWHTKSPLQGSFSESCLVYISHNCIRESANPYTHIHKIQTWLIFPLGNLQSSLRGGNASNIVGIWGFTFHRFHTYQGHCLQSA